MSKPKFNMEEHRRARSRSRRARRRERLYAKNNPVAESPLCPYSPQRRFILAVVILSAVLLSIMLVVLSTGLYTYKTPKNNTTGHAKGANVNDQIGNIKLNKSPEENKVQCTPAPKQNNTPRLEDMSVFRQLFSRPYSSTDETPRKRFGTKSKFLPYLVNHPEQDQVNIVPIIYTQYRRRNVVIAVGMIQYQYDHDNVLKEAIQSLINNIKYEARNYVKVVAMVDKTDLVYVPKIAMTIMKKYLHRYATMLLDLLSPSSGNESIHVRHGYHKHRMGPHKLF